MRYSDIETFLKAANLPSNPIINPGPATSAALQKLSPQAIVFASLGNGAGSTVEETFDRPFITIRAIGPQNDFTAAEDLAIAVDLLLRRVDHTTPIGTARALYIVRAGGGPSLINLDSGGRYHYQCTYITETESGV